MVRIGRDLLGGLRRQLLSFLFPSPQEKWQFQEHLDFFCAQISKSCRRFLEDFSVVSAVVSGIVSPLILCS